MRDDIIYFDNAATSFPKPPETVQAMRRVIEETGGSPGRSGHRMSIDAGREVFAAREALAGLFGVDDPLRIVLTKNATEALNIAICGFLQPGDHVVTSSMEHNSVMRPLRFLASRGMALSVVPCSPMGELDPQDLIAALAPKTKMVVLSHASNVTGTIMPVEAVGRITKERKIVLCVDAAQTAGSLPIDVGEMGIDLLAFTGHKALLGPQGTGGLYIREGLEAEIPPLLRGGTGSFSEFEEQPDFLPDKYEAGTLNAVGFAGLAAGATFVTTSGVSAVRTREEHLTVLCRDSLERVPGVELFGPRRGVRRMPIVSFRIRGIDPARTTWELDERYGVMARPGLHCAPSAHRTIGSAPTGTVRFSFGYFNTEEQVRTAVEAVSFLARDASRCG
jgi:cysteine desulfurase family protein